MTTHQQIILFDLPGKDGKCWSFNPWKTRFALNYKALPYTTEWLEYPDIKPRLEPHLDNVPAYTVPTIRYTDGRYIRDSRAIADLLEKEHPSPSLHLDSPYLSQLEKLFPELVGAVIGHFIPLVPKRILSDASQEYWYRTRESRLGMTLDALEEARGGPSDAAWAQAQPSLQKITGWLEENDEGPFFAGKEIGYADFVWAGFLLFFERLGQDKLDQLLRAAGTPETHKKLLAAVRPWAERNDH